ncbi:OadG family protein [Cellulosilyticum sp. ST5]|uniref:Sodium pump decarboxylase, gamma subunit n=1 Tax=Cellulosilyticum lentocellum (strain ATCC 49066 / DSM 5427 / NCIMB 11756 / RHM5) TaxID=642492 RepID=F2JS41_CELLD|nr:MULTISPECIES: OadG family protein [Cellulosilyticum]ADZ83978.1 sodium pump decarboxylase, gamma subunit [Cellulosilyticum lentocellum DSM 5427]QEH69444.1 hypothetical protein EKH84_14030 [Cellulosilyticum sp. WCF-2]
MNQSISAFLEGIPTFILSIVIVFTMLALLIGAIVLLGKMVGMFANKSNNVKVVESEASVIEEVVVAIEENSQDELELIAVITAAIAASMGTTSDQLQVRSLRKVQRKAL